MLAELDNMTTFCELNALDPNKEFSVRVKAQNELGTSSYSELSDTIKIPQGLGESAYVTSSNSKHLYKHRINVMLS